MTHFDSDHSFQELLENAGWLRRLAAQLVGPQHAEDLVQDAWLSALKGNPPAGSGLKPWLARVLRNRSIDWKRAQSRREWREELTAKEETLPSSDRLAERTESMRLLVTAVQKLPTVQRDVVLLRYLEEKSPAQIAVQLSMPASTVRSHLARGLKRLRVLLDESNGRDNWMQALAPLALPLQISSSSAPPIAGAATLSGTAILMSTSMKTAFVLCSILVLGAVWYKQTQKEPGEDLAVASVSGPQVDLAEQETADDTLPEILKQDRVPGIVEGPEGFAPIQGVLIDSGSGKPLGFCAIGLMPGRSPDFQGMEDPRLPEGYERVETDAQGRFASTQAYAPGEYHAQLLEDWDRFALNQVGKYRGEWPRKALDFAFEPSKPVRLEVRGGCFYGIECPQAESIGMEKFVVQLSQEDRPHRYADTWAPVLFGERSFVRFPVVKREALKGKTAWLHLVSRDGAWVGKARVNPCQGIADEVVSITLQECGSLLLKVEADTPPFTDGLNLSSFLGELKAEDLASLEASWSRIKSPGGFGGGAKATVRPVKFRRDYEPIGLHTIRVKSAGFAEQVQVVNIKPGENPEQVFVLQRQEFASGRIEGLVRVGPEGPPDHEVIVQVTEVGGTEENLRTAPVIWKKESGAWVGRFALKEMYDREYRVMLTPGMRVPRRGLRWKPRPLDYRVRPNGPALEFQLGTPVTLGDYEVRVFDAKTGDPLPKFEVLAFVEVNGEGEQDPVKGMDGLAKLRLPGAAHQVRLMAYAEGYAPGHLDFSQAPDARGISKNTMRLQPGWGAYVLVWDGNNFATGTLAGAMVIVDGVDMGRTDGEGALWLAMAERPTRIDVILDGYVLDSRNGPIDAAGELTEPQRGAPFDGFVFGLKRAE